MKALEAHKLAIEPMAVYQPEVDKLLQTIYGIIQDRAQHGYFDCMVEFNASQVICSAVIDRLFDQGYMVRLRNLDSAAMKQTGPESVAVITWSHPVRNRSSIKAS